MQNRKRLWTFLIAGGCILLLVPFSSWWLENPALTAGQAAVAGSHSMAATQPSEHERKALSKRSQDGGQTPASPAAPQRAPVQLSPAQQQLIGVTYGMVEKRPLTKVIRAVGRVEYNERKLAEVTLKIAGWIQDLYADYTGKLVKKGEPLFTLYSPDLVTAQEEYLLARHTQEQLKDSDVPGARASAQSLVQASRQRLLLWDLAPARIRALEEAGKPQLYQTIYSPLSGFIIEKTAYKGHRVESGMTLYKIADLSTVWVEADVYEYELSFVHVGQEAKVSLSSYPGEAFTAKVSYIYPYLEEKTRTGKVRLELANTPNWKFKPAMYATTELTVELGEKLVVPESAVLDSGVQQVVFVDKGEGRFAPQQVKVGSRVDHYIEVRGGLTAGERVVTSGNFLLDSESKLQAAESMMGMMGAIGMGDWKMESARPMDMGGMEGTETSSMQGMEKGGEKATVAQEKRMGPFTVTLSTLPETARVGENTVRIQVRDQGNKPVTTAQVSFTYTMDMPGMMIEEPTAAHTGEGRYEGKAKFAMAGPWGLVVTVAVPGQEPLREKFTVRATMP